MPAHFIAHRHLRETLVCPCGGHVVTADGPPRREEPVRAVIVASVITSKCADSIPHYRLEKEFERIGVPVARSTLADLFHRAAEQLGPLVGRMEQLVREALIVRADETSKKMMAPKKCNAGFIWTLRIRLPKPLIVYRCAASRSGETLRNVLGGTKGYLVVDAYSGYSDVVGVNRRKRVGRHAHLRRYFFEAKDAAPEASYKALDSARLRCWVTSCACSGASASWRSFHSNWCSRRAIGQQSYVESNFTLVSPLAAEGMTTVMDALLTTPRNVRVAVVCDRHRDLDAFFETAVVARAGVATVVVPPISDDELVTLVQTPAQALGITFENEALGALAEISGNRPWEIFSLCALLASRFESKTWKGNVTPAMLDALVDLEVLGETDEGKALLDNRLRILMTQMSAEERTVMELLSAGKDGEATEDALVRLQEAGFVVANDEGYAVNGALIEFVSRAVVEGVIKVSLE